MMTGEGDVDEQIREMLRQRCCRRHSRISEFSRDMPTDWRPHTLKNPLRPQEYFTDDSAWDFIAEQLSAGVPIERIVLQKPPGKAGYVLKVAGCAPVTIIYIKLQLGSSNVIGRSFHESTVVVEKVKLDERLNRAGQSIR